ncbi:MAG: TonB-dependent receptor [Candidatus Omnitrophica bacterium]|nr:TonB-dependent receptor [Candidatus Omnitrophota bacterium]
MNTKKVLGIIFAVMVCFSTSYCLEESVSNLGSIVISKKKVPVSGFDPTEGSIIGQQFNGSSLGGLAFSGVDLQSRSPMGDIQTDFVVRGGTFQDTQMLLNGRRINDPQTGHFNSDIPVTSWDIEKVEVLSGSASVLSGPDAVGGAVNFILKKPQAHERFLALTGGQDRTTSVLVGVSEKNKDAGFRLSLENQQSGGFHEDTDFKKFTGALNSSIRIPDGEFTAAAGYLDKEFGAYDFYTPGSGFPSREWIKTYLVNTGFALERGDWIIKPDFVWRRHYDTFMLDKTQVRSTYLNHHRNDTYTPSFYVSRDMGVFGRTGAGVEYGEEKIISGNLGNHSRRHTSIYSDGTKDLTYRLSAAAAIRFDDFNGYDKIGTGAVNLKYAFTEEHSVFTGLSKNIRVPSFTELYYNDPITEGNSGLQAAQALNYQIGYAGKKESLLSGITVFLRDEKDTIDWIKYFPGQGKWRADNIQGSLVLGVENRLGISIKENIFLESAYTFTQKYEKEEGYVYKYGSGYAKHVNNTSLNFSTPFGLQVIGMTYKKKTGRDGWFLLNTYLSYNFNSKSCVFFKVTNACNIEYQEIEGIPQPGRWIGAGIQMSW